MQCAAAAATAQHKEDAIKIKHDRKSVLLSTSFGCHRIWSARAQRLEKIGFPYLIFDFIYLCFPDECLIECSIKFINRVFVVLRSIRFLLSLFVKAETSASMWTVSIVVCVLNENFHSVRFHWQLRVNVHCIRVDREQVAYFAFSVITEICGSWSTMTTTTINSFWPSLIRYILRCFWLSRARFCFRHFNK